MPFAITGSTQLLGVIGDPVKHSLSPLMHNAAIAHMGLDYVYVAFPIQADNLEAAIAGFGAIGLTGFNITIPHKQAILPYLSDISPVAKAIGAVNTVWRTAAGWQGTNTDIDGFLAPLQSLPCDWSNTPALILGNGGAARAVVAGCAVLGCPEVYVVGRSAEKRQAFEASWQGSNYGHNLRTADWNQLTDLVAHAGLIVNTTPIGMAPDPNATPLAAPILDKLQSKAIVYDLIYTPNPTVLLQLAQIRGAIVFDGLEMLVQQGAAALRIWTGREDVPVAVMRDRLRLHLGLG